MQLNGMQLNGIVHDGMKLIGLVLTGTPADVLPPGEEVDTGAARPAGLTTLARSYRLRGVVT